MRAVAVTPRIKNSAELIEADKPVVNNSEVLVKVLMIRFDGSNREINEGLYGEAPEG